MTTSNKYWQYPEKVDQIIEMYHGEGCSAVDRICDDQYTKDDLRADLIQALSNMELDSWVDSGDGMLSELIHYCILPRKEFNFIEGLEESFLQNPCDKTQYNIILLSGKETRLWQDKKFLSTFKASNHIGGWWQRVIPMDKLHHFRDEITLYEKERLERATTKSFREKNGIDSMSMAERVDFMWQLDKGHRKYRRTLGKDGSAEDFSDVDILDIYLTMKTKKGENPERYRIFANIFLHDVDKRLRKLGKILLNESLGVYQSLILD